MPAESPSPAASIIVTCFNLGRYLDEAVGSALAQTFEDFEILVVDDGSTDEETCRLLEGYRRPKTRVLRSENRGLPAAKNLGVANTSGAYLCTLDADDRLEPTFLEKSVAVLEAEPDLAFVSHWLRTFGDEEGEWTPTRCDLAALLDMNTVNGAALVRRTAVEAAGGFDERLRDGCEDWDFWITLVERGLMGRILPEFLYQYRRHDATMTRWMMQGDRHPRLYRQLARKHVGSFRAHLPALLARREADMATLRAETHDLALDRFTTLDPQVMKMRDDVAGLERGAGPGRLEAAVETARAEVAAIRGSLSWRLTAPLRAVYDALGLGRVRRAGPPA